VRSALSRSELGRPRRTYEVPEPREPGALADASRAARNLTVLDQAIANETGTRYGHASNLIHTPCPSGERNATTPSPMLVSVTSAIVERCVHHRGGVDHDRHVAHAVASAPAEAGDSTS